jgi:flagellar basal-body rod modification protein FlgD
MQVGIDSLINTDGTVKTTSSTTSSSKKSNDALSKLDFLNLLTTQLKYQDPLNPQSNTDMAAQLAQYSSLEAMQDIKTAIQNQTDKFDTVVSSLQTSSLSITNSTAVSLIGKNVKLKQTEIEYNGESVDFNVHLGSNTSATVTLCNQDGTVVKTLSAAAENDATSTTLSWDGTTDDGTLATDGTYTINIENEDSDSSLYSYVNGLVSSVLFTTDRGAVINVNGNELSIGNVMEIS